MRVKFVKKQKREELNISYSGEGLEWLYKLSGNYFDFETKNKFKRIANWVGRLIWNTAFSAVSFFKFKFLLIKEASLNLEIVVRY